MPNNPQPTPPLFQPVPAIPVTVESTRAGECRVRTAGGVFTGATLREAIDAAINLPAPAGAAETP